MLDIETFAKRTARSVVKPLIPDELYARIVTWYYRLFASKPQAADWHAFLGDPRLDPTLRDMMLAYERLVPSDQTSEYWRTLNNKNVQQILDQGFENFKQTIALNYFTWLLEKNNNQEKYLRRHLPSDAVARAEARAKGPAHSLFGPADSRVFDFTTSLLWEFVVSEVGAATVERLAEPKLGNPPGISLDGRLVSQDLANSALEFDSIRRGIQQAGGDALWSSIRTVTEIGAGYGRTAFVFQSLKPELRYVIGDIPPALYVSQRYLSEVFPQLPAFKFRPFEAFPEVRSEFQASRLAFVVPSQLELLPDASTDLFVAIDCLHEMLPAQVASYFDLVDRTARYFYFTCRKITAIGYDGLVVREKDYPVKPHWKQIFRQERRVQDDYFEVLYEIRK